MIIIFLITKYVFFIYFFHSINKKSYRSKLIFFQSDLEKISLIFFYMHIQICLAKITTQMQNYYFFNCLYIYIYIKKTSQFFFF